ncbi:TRAP transporter small permease [Pseudooceanicola sp. MF1-13]|uniref:TRAP transporter small permease n=1 Tax=Pseudooceanicola sp. MF1-13 TaxID=3379095 RepID=UPI003891B56D
MAEQIEKSGVVIRFMHGIAGLGLIVMMLVVVADVVLRAVFNFPVQGAYDVVSISLLIMTFFGIAPVVATRREILIDLIDGFLPPFALRVIGVVAALLGLLIFAFFGWSMIAPAMDAWNWGEQSLELGIPKWPLWVVAFVGLIGIGWAFLVQLTAAARRPSSAPDEEGGL